MLILSAGVSDRGVNMLKQAGESVFGIVEVRELTSNNLRSMVRLSNSVEVVLVILDQDSSEKCADIAGDLYNTDKYHTYTTDRSLALFLNDRYGLSLDVPEEEIKEDVDVAVEPEEDIVSNEVLLVYEEKLKECKTTIRNLEDRLSFKDGVISSLEYRVKELEELYVEELSESDLLVVNSGGNVSSDLESKLNAKTAELEEVLAKLNKVSANYKDLDKEYKDLKVTNSRQAGVLHDKEVKIQELENSLGQIDGLTTAIADLKEKLNNKDEEISQLNEDLTSKDKEYSDMVSEKEVAINLLEKDLEIALSEKERLQGKVDSVSDIEEENEANKLKIEELEQKVEELQNRVDDDNSNIILLNKEKIELQNELNILKEAQVSSDSEEGYINQIKSLTDRVASLQSDILTKIGSSVTPNSFIGGRILSGQGKFNNIRFAFAGGADSRRGAYKCLYDEFKKSPEGLKYLIVDLVSETAIDYVFAISRVKSGLGWLQGTDSLENCLSSTSLENTMVLSPGLSYVNDCYFLYVDWSSRLAELERSGYKVVVFCGDISNLVGRVLHQSFASYGDSVIYVKGNSVGMRTIVSNLRGLSNSKDSTVAYYEYNSSLSGFLNLVNKTNECVVLSSKESR